MLTELSKPRLQITAVELNTWISLAEPGDTLAYHRGFLLIDRLPIGSRLGRADRKELDRVASAAMAMAEAEHVYLVQRRHGPGDYSYLVVASSADGRRSPGRTGPRTREPAS